MAQSKNFGAINFILFFALLIGLVARVSAHGVLLSPPTRLMYDRKNETEVLAQVNNPTMKFPCGTAGDEPGPVTAYKPSEKVLFSYKVNIAHGGDCLAQMSWKGDDHFETLENMGECGKEVGLFMKFVELPHKTCDKCVFRFMWVDDLGNNYLNCANVQVKESHDYWSWKRSGTGRRRL